VYSTYLDKTIPPQSYTCIAFSAGWAPTDTGWYIVKSWIDARPGVDVVLQNSNIERRYYVKEIPVKNVGNVNQSVQGNSTNNPTTFALMPNTPNPFKNYTTIRWQIPLKSNVTISIYDATGRVIKTLVNNEFNVGYYNTNWNCADENNHTVSAGIYFYEMRADNYLARYKMVINN
jgi:hypothetical protein